MIWYLGSMLLVGLFWVIVLIGAHYNKEDSTSVWFVEEKPIREMVILTLIPPLFGILLLYGFYRGVHE